MKEKLGKKRNSRMGDGKETLEKRERRGVAAEQVWKY